MILTLVTILTQANLKGQPRNPDDIPLLLLYFSIVIGNDIIDKTLFTKFISLFSMKGCDLND